MAGKILCGHYAMHRPSMSSCTILSRGPCALAGLMMDRPQGMWCLVQGPENWLSLQWLMRDFN